MLRRNGRYVIRRDNNVLEVDFGREPDPPAPKFPGAGGLRELTERGREAEWSDGSITAARRRHSGGCFTPKSCRDIRSPPRQLLTDSVEKVKVAGRLIVREITIRKQSPIRIAALALARSPVSLT